MLRGLGRGLGEDLGVDRNETDGTTNTDNQSSVFHISHHLVRFIPAHEIIFDCDTGNGSRKGIRKRKVDSKERCLERRVRQIGRCKLPSSLRPRCHEWTLSRIFSILPRDSRVAERRPWSGRFSTAANWSASGIRATSEKRSAGLPRGCPLLPVRTMRATRLHGGYWGTSCRPSPYMPPCPEAQDTTLMRCYSLLTGSLAKDR